MAEARAATQDALVAMEAYQRQLDALSRQIDFLQSGLDDLVRARRTLESLEDGGSAEILIPLGAATFVPGKLDKKAKVITGIGANLSVERPRAEAVARLSEREAGVQKELERLMQAAVEIQQEAARLQAEVEGSE